MIGNSNVASEQCSSARMTRLSQEQKSMFEARKVELEEKRQALVRQHRDERQKLREIQHSNWQHKQQAWWNNFNTGVRTLFDRITGKHRKIEQRNEQDAWHFKTQQQQERDTLIFQQLETRCTLQSRIERLEALKSYQLDELNMTGRNTKPCASNGLSNSKHNAGNTIETVRRLASAPRTGHADNVWILR